MQARFRSVIDKARRARDTFRSWVTRGLLDRPPRDTGKKSPRVVFVRWDGKLGDSIVLSWVYRELMQSRPDLQVTVLTHTALVSMHQSDFGVKDVMVCNKRPGFFEILKLSRQVRHARYVVHLTEHFKPRDFWFIRCVAPGQVIGLDDSVQSVSFKLGQATASDHFSEKLLPWFASLGILNPDTRYIVPDRRLVRDLVLREWPANTRVTGFCPYGAGSNRRLSGRMIKEMVQIMCEESGHVVMILADASARTSVVRETGTQINDSSVCMMPGKGDLETLFETVRHCDCIVTVDTAIVHIATGLDKPQLALYNPDSAEHANFVGWHPNSPRALTLFAQKSVPQKIDSVDLREFREKYRQLVSACS